jgi:hypothetical protein
MADYAISNVPRRVVYAASGVGPYAFTFEILAASDIAVYKASTLLTLTTDYTVTINSNGTGSVTLVTSAGTSNITIVGSKTIARTTDFTTGGDFFANTLNDELDAQTIFIQQVAETAERGLKAPVTDPTDIAMTLPARDGRKGKVLAFDSVTGNPVAGPALDSLISVTDQSANINIVADNIDDVIAVADNETNINTVAGVSSNVTTVAGSISNVNTVADDLNEAVSEINTVGTNITNVNTVGNNISNVNTVAGVSAGVTTVAGISSNVTTVAGIAPAVSNVSSISSAVSGVNSNSTNINAVNANKTNIDTVAGIAANVTTVAGISSNVTSVAGNSTNINTVATNIANVNSVGTNIANVNSVAGNSTNINAVAGNSTNINTVAGISSNVTTVATNSANVTTVAGSIANVNTNATNIANINQNAANIVAIQNASANATAAASSATAAAGSATSASASAAAASAVALGNEPVRHSVRPSLLLDFANTKTLDPRITFTRASTGTFYDGKTVAKAEENLVTFSQGFSNTSFWTAAATDGLSSVTDNSVVAPDGTTTAATFVENSSASTPHGIRNNAGLTIINGQPHTASVFLKAGTRQFAALVFFTGSVYEGVVVDLSGGTITSTTGTLTSSSITSVGNGWHRVVITKTLAVASTFFGLFLSDTGTPTFSAGRPSYTGNGTGSVLVWGAQLEQRSSVTAYTATTTAPITNYIPALQSAASGVARFEHNPTTGESLGLEIEEQRTNLLLQSETFDNASWSRTGASVTANAVVAPDGTLTADRLVEDTSGADHRTFQGFTTTSGVAYTLSVYAKAAGRTRIQLFNSGGIALDVTFDLSSGTITNTNQGTGSIVSVGNGWYRCSVSNTANATSAGNNQIRLITGVNTTSYTGDGWSGVFLWGAQLEAGAFATSYIPTVASQVTRSADAASMTGANFSSWYRADEGSVYAESFIPTNADGAFGNYYCAISDGTVSNNILMAEVDGTVGQVVVNGSVQFNQKVGSEPTTFTKMALAYKTNDFIFCVNSTLSAAGTSGRLPVVDRLFIGTRFDVGITSTNGTIKKLAYYAKKLTNAELQGLTTV